MPYIYLYLHQDKRTALYTNIVVFVFCVYIPINLWFLTSLEKLFNAYNSNTLSPLTMTVDLVKFLRVPEMCIQ